MTENRKMGNFDTACDAVLMNEGLLSDNPKDPGGLTKHGISLRFLKSLPDTRKYDIPVADEDAVRKLTIDQARHIYHDEFWVPSGVAKIGNPEVARYVFDCMVNCGISPGVKILQRAIWAIWRNRKELPDDGILGAQTLRWVDRCGSMYLLPALRAERAAYYRSLNNPEFIEGWLNRAYSM